ncbi:MAG: TetR/AcrR family transcriptional regulator [Treponema sp.]|jgi:AcrR family transcriptional regulator|nr:TetR/AcrR family transcriptional regulator [Treponema sp.]
MRVFKKPEVRKSEILDAAEKLFAAKGYEKATVNDILAAVNIAKGTFYYYFKSKEDVLNTIVQRRMDEGVERAQAVAANPNLEVHEKLLAVIMALKSQNPMQENLPAILHEPDNVQLHQKMLIESVLRLSPILSDVVEEGIKQGIFNTTFPMESIEILLTAALVLFDEAYFQWQPDETTVKVSAFLCAMERILGAEAGSFAVFAKVFAEK